MIRFAASLLVVAMTASAQPAPDLQTEHVFRGSVPVMVPYLLHLPDGYDDTDEPWPLLLFLHGAGERGDSLALVKQHGPLKLIAQGERLPFVVVAPQAPAGGGWDALTLLALLDDITAAYRVDEDRMYVTGLSMGGFGTWALIGADPDRFAAAVPICGGGEPWRACTIGRLPVWAFHGAADPVVPLKRSEAMVRALEACGGDVRLTTYPSVGHDSWTVTYANPELYEWLLRHRRSDRE